MKIVPHRFSVLDGMRGAAAFAVLIHHFTQHTSRPLFSGASLAVDLLFCLGGFVMAHSYLDRLGKSMTLLDFVSRRVVRLYPMFFFGFVLGSVVLIGKVAFGQSSLGYKDAGVAVFVNSLGLPFVSDFYVQVGRDAIRSAIFPTNDPLWSMFFTAFSSVFFAYVALRAQVAYWFLLCVVGAFFLVLWCALNYSGAPGWGAENIAGGVPRAVFGLSSGVCACFVFSRYGKYIPVIRPSILMFFLAVLFFKWWSYYIWIVEAIVVVPAIVLFGAVSVSSCAREARAHEYIGRLSYPVYCLHFPVYSLFTLMTGNSDYGIVGLLVCAPISVLLSHFLAGRAEEKVMFFVSRLVTRRALGQ